MATDLWSAAARRIPEYLDLMGFERLSPEEKADALRRYVCGPHEPIWPAKP